MVGRAREVVVLDEDVWGRTCRMMETLVEHGNIEAAHRALDLFVSDNTAQTRLEFSSPLSLVCPPELANMLEQSGYRTIGSVLHESDARICEVPMLGAKRLKQLRELLKFHGFKPSLSALEIRKKQGKSIKNAP